MLTDDQINQLINATWDQQAINAEILQYIRQWTPFDEHVKRLLHTEKIEFKQWQDDVNDAINSDQLTEAKQMIKDERDKLIDKFETMDDATTPARIPEACPVCGEPMTEEQGIIVCDHRGLSDAEGKSRQDIEASKRPKPADPGHYSGR